MVRSSGCIPGRAVGRRAAFGGSPAAPGAQPYLGARSVLPGSGDMTRDGVPRLGHGAAAHSLAAGQESAWQLAGGRSRPQVHRFMGAAGRVVGSRGRPQSLLAKFAQGVVAAAGELAGHRQGGQPGGAPVPGFGVVAVVGAAGRAAHLADSYKRPAHQLGSLPGQVPGGALGLGGLDGDVQPGVADHIIGVGEPAHVAEFGPDRHRGDRPDAGWVARSAAQPGWRRDSMPSWRRSGSSWAVSQSICRSPAWTACRPAGDSSTRSTAARPSGLAIEPIAGTPWWNKVAAIRWCRAPR